MFISIHWQVYPVEKYLQQKPSSIYLFRRYFVAYLHCYYSIQQEPLKPMKE